MDKGKIMEFFDRLAPCWDGSLPPERVLRRVLAASGLPRGGHILDVACGTGVLFPFYLEDPAARVTGIDLSREMLAAAGGKFGKDPRVTLLWGDAEESLPPGPFDGAMVFNALPHFPHPEKLIPNLSRCIPPGGRLCIAHGAGREAIDHCHQGCPKDVSRPLMAAEELAFRMRPFFRVDRLISDEGMYLVGGERLP